MQNTPLTEEMNPKGARALSRLVEKGVVRLRPNFGMLAVVCHNCGEAETFCAHGDERGPENLPVIAPMDLGEVAGVPNKLVWVVECGKCGTFNALRKRVANLARIQAAIDKLAMEPNTKIPSPRFDLYWCSLDDLVEEIRKEPDPLVKAHVIEVFEEHGWELEGLEEMKRELGAPSLADAEPLPEESPDPGED